MRLHRGDQLVVVDPPIVGTGDGAQFDATALGLQRLDLLGAVGGQPVLQVDARQRRGQLAQIGGRRADQRGELPELQCVGATGSRPSPGNQLQPLGVSRLASTRIAALSTVRVWLRSARPFTEPSNPTVTGNARPPAG